MRHGRARAIIRVMTRYRDQWPAPADRLFVSDGGLETTLIFHDGFDLPHFAAFVLLASEKGRSALREYYLRYAGIAREHGLGVVLESPTWRANPDWGAKVGYSAEALDRANREGVTLLSELRAENAAGEGGLVISGCLGPRADGYRPTALMSADEAARYHARQIETFRDSGADLVSALTMNYVDEAVGIARAARSAGMPVVISFTVETDGKLPTGQALREAIEQVDRETDGAPAYYMINCAHPTHFESSLVAGEPWMERIKGLKVNASTMSHAELDEAEELDDGDPEALGKQCGELHARFRHINVLGGCCGTDHRHVAAMARSIGESR